MKEAEESGKELTAALAAAASGRPEAIKEFFRVLLSSTVVVPIKPAAPREQAAVLGKTTAADLGLMIINYEGHKCLPIFSERAFAEFWLKERGSTTEKELKSLLWLIGEDTWMYLNPNQEVGKEISAWEVERLKQGTDAIDELTAAQEEDSSLDELELEHSPDGYEELKRKLIPILEIYPQLEEAFLIEIKEAGEGSRRPVLGIKYAGKISASKKEYVKNEILRVAEEYRKESEALLHVADDLADEKNVNEPLFREAMPFYLARKPLPRSGFAARLWNSLRGKRKELQAETADDESAEG